MVGRKEQRIIGPRQEIHAEKKRPVFQIQMKKAPKNMPRGFFHFELLADAYFFSSTGFSGLCTGGAGGGGDGGEPLIPSLKLRMPSPNPFITSGMRRPPKKINTMAKTISQWKMLNSPMRTSTLKLYPYSAKKRNSLGLAHFTRLLE
jgi:hypothetical protein